MTFEDYLTALLAARDAVFQSLCRRVGEQDASDLVQEAFAVALRKYNRFDPALGTPAWYFFGIARNMANQRFKMRSRDNARHVPFEEDHQQDLTPDLLDDFIRSDMARVLAFCEARMVAGDDHDGDMRLFFLHQHERLSADTLAATQGCSRATLYRRLDDGLEHARLLGTFFVEGTFFYHFARGLSPDQRVAFPALLDANPVMVPPGSQFREAWRQRRPHEPHQVELSDLMCGAVTRWADESCQPALSPDNTRQQVALTWSRALTSCEVREGGRDSGPSSPTTPTPSDLMSHDRMDDPAYRHVLLRAFERELGLTHSPTLTAEDHAWADAALARFGSPLLRARALLSRTSAEELTARWGEVLREAGPAVGRWLQHLLPMQFVQPVASMSGEAPPTMVRRELTRDLYADMDEPVRLRLILSQDDEGDLTLWGEVTLSEPLHGSFALRGDLELRDDQDNLLLRWSDLTLQPRPDGIKRELQPHYYSREALARSLKIRDLKINFIPLAPEDDQE